MFKYFFPLKISKMLKSRQHWKSQNSQTLEIDEMTIFGNKNIAFTTF